MSGLDDKLEGLARQYDEVQAELAKPETSTDPNAIRRLGRELSRMEPAVESYRQLLEIRRQLAGAREMRETEHDDDLQAMAQEEIERLTRRRGAPARRARPCSSCRATRTTTAT